MHMVWKITPDSLLTYLAAFNLNIYLILTNLMSFEFFTTNKSYGMFFYSSTLTVTGPERPHANFNFLIHL